MGNANTAVLEFLQTRRSRPAKTLTDPVPSREEIEHLLIMAARTPDHGKLEPWRFIVIGRDTCLQFASDVERLTEQMDISEERAAKSVAQFGNAQCVVAVVASPKDTAKVPLIEQHLSAGAVCLSLLNAALASGWGANWLTGWMAFDPVFGREILGLETHEFVAGFMHLGTETSKPPERPRPNVPAITQWL